MIPPRYLGLDNFFNEPGKKSDLSLVHVSEQPVSAIASNRSLFVACERKASDVIWMD